MNLIKKIIAATTVFFASTFVSAESSSIMHKLPVEVIDTGGTLLFSDSPEYVDRDGILYTDTVSGDARILFYHLNNSTSQKKIAVVVENVSSKKTTVEITRGGFSAPSENYFAVGKATQLTYMKKNFHDTLKLSSREKKLLQEEFNLVTIDPQNLVYGVYDIHSKEPVQIFILMCPIYADPITFLSTAEILPKDEQRLRGTFKRMNRTIKLQNIYNPATDGIGYVMIGDEVNDIFKRGIDATDNSEVVNVGNYGINYTLDFRTKSKTRFCLSPLGGVYSGAINFTNNGDFGVIQTPRDKLFFGEQTPPESEAVRISREDGLALFTNSLELCELGSYKGRIIFEYSPPGASNLPVHFILFPTN